MIAIIFDLFDYDFGAPPAAGFADAGDVSAGAAAAGAAFDGAAFDGSAFDGATCTVRFLPPLALAADPSLASGCAIAVPAMIVSVNVIAKYNM